MDRIIKKILIKRGYKTEKQISDFLSPSRERFFHDPGRLKDLSKGVTRVRKAIKKKQKIAVYGDFDGDGIPGAAMMFLTLKKLGAREPMVKIGKSHDIDPDFVMEAARKGYKLLIAIDLGITSFKAAELASKLGIDLIIIEHHIVQRKKPKCFAHINPKQKGDEYPWPHLSGAGLAFKFISAMSKNILEDYSNYFAILTAIAAIHDQVPMRDENRFLVKNGIEAILKTRDSDLLKVIKILKVKKNIVYLGHETVFHVFEMLINLFGSQESCELLIESGHPPGFIKNLIKSALRFHRYLNKAVSKIKRHPHLYKKNVLFEVFEDLPYVTIGAVANRTFNIYGMTTIIIRKGENGFSRGSARSSRALNLVEMLEYCSKFLEGFGGHLQAAGFRIKNSNIEDFKKKVEEYLVRNFPGGKVPQNKLDVDYKAVVKELTPDLYAEISRLAPFGQQNPVPVFSLKNVKIYFDDDEVAIKDGTGVISGKNSFDRKDLSPKLRYNVIGHLALKDNLPYFIIRELKQVKK